MPQANRILVQVAMKKRDHPLARSKKPRKRTVLPEFAKLMAKKPGDDIQAALDEVRGDDPGATTANSAPASFPPQDVARTQTNTSELADLAEAEHAKNKASSPLPPPLGYVSWLDYAVATMDTRSLFNNLTWGLESQWPDDTSREQMEDAVRAELAQLRSDNKRKQPS